MTDPSAEVEPSQAGRVGPHRESHESRLLLSNFLDAQPVSYQEWDGTRGITDWGMDGNDKWGCCGPAATDHNNVAKSGDISELNTLGQPVYDGTLPTYFAYGTAIGEPGPEPDNGVDNSSWLGFLYTKGIIKGYAEVPLDQLDLFAPMFDGVITGQRLNSSAVQDFEATPRIPWGSDGETLDPTAGHDTLIIQLHADGSGVMVTWGGLQPFTLNYRQTNIQDAWVILDEDDLRRAGANEAQIAAWQAALQEVHGTVDVTPSSADTPPQPVPPESIFARIEHEVATVVEDVVTEIKKEVRPIFGRHNNDVAEGPGPYPGS